MWVTAVSQSSTAEEKLEYEMKRLAWDGNEIETTIGWKEVEEEEDEKR